MEFGDDGYDQRNAGRDKRTRLIRKRQRKWVFHILKLDQLLRAIIRAEMERRRTMGRSGEGPWGRCRLQTDAARQEGDGWIEEEALSQGVVSSDV